MRMISVLAALAASPALAHNASLSHAHSDWSLPVGLCLIALAAVVAGARSYARVRRDRK